MVVPAMPRLRQTGLPAPPSVGTGAGWQGGIINPVVALNSALRFTPLEIMQQRGKYIVFVGQAFRPAYCKAEALPYEM